MVESIGYYATNIYSYVVNSAEPVSDGFWSSSNNLGSYITGILVFFSCGLITFLIKENYKVPPSFSGVFYLKLKTTTSAYNPYKGLESYFMITMMNDSKTKSIGRIEKIYDIEPNGKKRAYVGRNRNIGEVSVLIERFYVKRNRLSMHITFNGDKNGAQRDSSTVILFDKATKETQGTFNSTAADSKGCAWLQNCEF